MRVPSVAICTITALSFCSIYQALAIPPSGTQKPAASNYVVPVETIPTPPASTEVRPALSAPSAAENDLVVTATGVQIVGATEELQQIVSSAIKTRLGGATSQSQVQNDVAAILATGMFADASVTTQTTPDGVNVIYQVKPAVMRLLQLSGAQVLTPAVANDLFKSQLGAPISPAALRQGVEQINQWYAKNGYVLAQVLALRPTREGVVTIEVAEGVVGDVNIRFLDKDGKPTQGRSKPDFLTRQLTLKPGQVFQVNVARGDLQTLFKLGLFDKADVSLNGDARKVLVSYDVTERPTRSVNAGGGYSADSGLVGTVSYKDQNLGGVNQQVGINLQASTRDLQFDGNFTNPYNPSDPNKLGYTINGFRRRGLSQTFDDQIKLANGDQAREGQFGGGLTFSKPVDDWQASVGLNYTRTSVRDRAGNVSPVDERGNPLTFSKTGIDDLVTLSAGVSTDRRDNPVNPTQGSVLSLRTEQSLPIGSGNILMNRLQANYSQYIPARIFDSKQPEVLAFNVQGGTTIGDLPPYQAFNLGGLNSVRGYDNGQVASGRSYVLASAEYRFPIFSPLGAVFFADYASDLGSGDTVPGEPGVARGKPGSGFGYGAGLRLNSPIGIIRADFGINAQGESRVQFGVGQRF